MIEGEGIWSIIQDLRVPAYAALMCVRGLMPEKTGDMPTYKTIEEIAALRSKRETLSLEPCKPYVKTRSDILPYGVI
jgi:hypothetical protein